MGAVIRCDPLDGEWQTLGAGRYRGVVAENIEATTNVWGPDQLSFTLKTVEPAALRPDLLPYTPLELEIDGMLVWSGQVQQRPSTEREHQITARGWQYHLDDDSFERAFVHTRLSEWVDYRANLACTVLGRIGTAAGQVNATDLGIVFGWPKGAQVNGSSNAAVGVMLDLGPDSTCKRLYVAFEKISATPSSGFVNYVVRGTDVPDVIAVSGGTSEDIFAGDVTSLGASGSHIGTFTTARRYLAVFIYYFNAANVTFGEDQTFRLSAIRAFRSTAYESGNASILKADSVIKDALAFAPLLNQSTGLITAGTFSIPEYRTDSYQPPRAVIESVNAYENYDLRIGGADLKTLVYAPKATVPSYVVGEWSGSQFADASVAGDDIYNRAVVTGTGADGAPLVSKRTQTGTLIDRNNAAAVRTKVLPIRSAGTSAVYDRFGDLWLTDHKLSPFAGKLAASTGIRRWLGGASVPSHELLLAAGTRIHLSHRIDPDTGACGRDGFIVGVRYRHDGRSVEVDIDDRRDHFESILQRYGILVDQFT